MNFVYNLVVVSFKRYSHSNNNNTNNNNDNNDYTITTYTM